MSARLVAFVILAALVAGCDHLPPPAYPNTVASCNANHPLRDRLSSEIERHEYWSCLAQRRVK